MGIVHRIARTIAMPEAHGELSRPAAATARFSARVSFLVPRPGAFPPPA